jgi:hypothetical protein
MTPEGKIKRQVKIILDSAFPEEHPSYHEMLVGHGYGRPGLDFTCCLFGRFVSIETKAPGEWLTPRQRLTALSILRAGGKVFIISGEDGLAALRCWIVRTGAQCLQ